MRVKCCTAEIFIKDGEKHYSYIFVVFVQCLDDRVSYEN